MILLNTPRDKTFTSYKAKRSRKNGDLYFTAHPELLHPTRLISCIYWQHQPGVTVQYTCCWNRTLRVGELNRFLCDPPPSKPSFMSISKLLNIWALLKDPIKDSSKIQLVRDYVFMTYQWYHNYVSGTSLPFFLREYARDPYNDGNEFQLQWS